MPEISEHYLALAFIVALGIALEIWMSMP